MTSTKIARDGGGLGAAEMEKWGKLLWCNGSMHCGDSGLKNLVSTFCYFLQEHKATGMTSWLKGLSWTIRRHGR